MPRSQGRSAQHREVARRQPVPAWTSPQMKPPLPKPQARGRPRRDSLGTVAACSPPQRRDQGRPPAPQTRACPPPSKGRTDAGKAHLRSPECPFLGASALVPQGGYWGELGVLRGAGAVGGLHLLNNRCLEKQKGPRSRPVTQGHGQVPNLPRPRGAWGSGCSCQVGVCPSLLL